jgi:hypothetical protein
MNQIKVTDEFLGYDFKGRPIHVGDRVRVLEIRTGPKKISGKCFHVTGGRTIRGLKVVDINRPLGNLWCNAYPDCLEVVKRYSNWLPKAVYEHRKRRNGNGPSSISK